MDKASKKNPKNDEDEEEEVEDEDNQNESENNDEENDEDMDEEEYVEEEVDEDVFDFDNLDEDEKPSDTVENKQSEANQNQINQNSIPKEFNVKQELNKEKQSDNKSTIDDEAKENLKKLMKLDLESTPKEDVVNLLMKTELKAPKIEESKKRKQKTRFNVESQYNIEKLQSETLNKFRTNMNELKENPELSNDFNTAIKKLKQKMLQEPELKEQKVYKILFSDKEKTKSDVERLSSVKTDYIGKKVKDYLVQKQRKIEDISEKLNEEMKQKCTFNPEILNNIPELENNKRSLEQFLSDQNKHLEKVERKVLEFRDKKEKEELQNKENARPKIDPMSQRIFEEKIKTEDKPYERLYKQRFGMGKNDLMENSGKIRSNTQNKISNEKNNKKIDKIEEYLIKKEKDKKPISKKEAEEHIKKLYQSANDKKEKLEKLKEKVTNEETKGVSAPSASYESNKFVLKNVMKKYKEEINTIFSNLMKSTGRNTIDFTSNLNEGEDPILNQIQLNRISLIQTNQLLQQLGFVSRENPNVKTNSIEDVTNSENPSQIQPESFLKLEEKKLACEMWEALKDSDGFLNVDHLFIFILAVINLYEYYLYSSFKKATNLSAKSIEESKRQKEDINDATKKDKEKQEILSKIANDINSKIKSQGKYSAFDSDKNFLISFEKSKLIKKDFNLFYINFMNSNSIIKKKSAQNGTNFPQANPVFKPNINKNSAKLYNQYRKKLARELENSIVSLNATSTGKQKVKSHSEYIYKLIAKKKKNESIYAKAREEISKNEIAECTFKPKIIEDYPIKNDSLQPIDFQGKKMKVWEKLYKIGFQIVSNRKNKPRDDIELILNGKECSFKPNTEKPSLEDDIKDNIYAESYETLYNRLKNGRTERKLKEAVHEKWDFPEEYYEHLNKNKIKNYVGVIKNPNNINKNIPQPIAPERASFKDLVVDSETNSALTPAEFNLGTSNSSNLRQSNTSFEEEKKDAIPLLIIDVNIRPGVKKKIYVYDGDTADALADKFSKEHNLDAETRSKLQVLIQSHMSRLLMRIDEENQSLSEKSSAYNLS